MPLTQLTLSAQLGWTLSQPVTGFAPDVQGPDNASAGLTGLSLTTWNELFGAQYTIAGSGGTQVVNLNSFTDLAQVPVTALHALALFIAVTGAVTDTLNVKPAASNTLQWFFGGTTHSINIHGGGAFLWTDPISAIGAALSASVSSLLLTNTGAAPLTVKVVALVGTT